jgi:hypothetical protein
MQLRLLTFMALLNKVEFFKRTKEGQLPLVVRGELLGTSFVLSQSTHVSEIINVNRITSTLLKKCATVFVENRIPLLQKSKLELSINK